MKMITVEEDNKMKKTGLWEVYHISQHALMNGLNHTSFEAMAYPNRQENVVVDMEHYTMVATINLKGEHTWLWRLTNNVDESWSNDFRGEHETWDMVVHNQEGGMGHRSSMCGDIYYDVVNDKHYMIIGMGHARLENYEEEE